MSISGGLTCTDILLDDFLQVLIWRIAEKDTGTANPIRLGNMENGQVQGFAKEQSENRQKAAKRELWR